LAKILVFLLILVFSKFVFGKGSIDLLYGGGHYQETARKMTSIGLGLSGQKEGQQNREFSISYVKK